MTSIKGYAELAGLEENISPRGAAFVEKIGIATNRLIEMTGDLLNTLAMSDAAPLQREATGLDDIVRQVIYDLEGAALGKSMPITVEVANEPFQIYGDPSRLYHAVLNLVENAIKYAEPETPIDISLQYGQEFVRMAVADRGPGIPEDEIPRVFDQYFRSSRNTGQPGTGLGLSVVAATVQAHGGEVSVSNREGGGATFEMYLPALRAKCACLTSGDIH
jgi:signal transduction histidine kinase